MFLYFDKKPNLYRINVSLFIIINEDNMKNTKILFLLFISLLLTGNTFASSIDRIEATSNNNIELTASSDVVFSDINVEWELKLLKDVNVSFSTKDSENWKKVLLNLSSNLTANTSYSLISILGADWNIDFEIDDFLEWEITNVNLLDSEEWIEKINIVDSTTIELFFRNDLLEDVFEFKILSEIETKSLKSAWNNVLNLESSKNLEVSTDYIVMILSLEDAMWNSISFNEDLYDLTTPAILEKAIQEEEVVIAIPEEEQEVIDEWNIEEIALQSAETPETWTTTSILIMVALLANLAFFFRKKLI